MRPGDVAILFVVMVIAVIDLILVLLSVQTISRRMRSIGRRVAFLPYSWGVFGGHFWGPHRPPLLGSWWASIGLLIGTGVVLSLVHWFARRWIPKWSVLLYLLCGIPAGIYLWPQ